MYATRALLISVLPILTGSGWPPHSCSASLRGRPRLKILVGEVIEACRAHRTVTIEEVTVAREDVHFKLPRALAS